MHIELKTSRSRSEFRHDHLLDKEKSVEQRAYKELEFLPNNKRPSSPN